MDSAITLRTADALGTGELRFQRTDYDNGDRWYSVVFHPRDSTPDELAATGYRPPTFYHVAWARLPRSEAEPIVVATDHNVMVVLGMTEHGKALPPISVERVEHVEPVLELIGRAFATAYDLRRRGRLDRRE